MSEFRAYKPASGKEEQKVVEKKSKSETNLISFNKKKKKKSTVKISMWHQTQRNTQCNRLRSGKIIYCKFLFFKK